MPQKPCYLNLFFISIVSSLVSAAPNTGAVISPQQVVVTPGSSVSFNCTLPTDNVLRINWFIDGELYNSQSDDEDIRTARDRNGSGSIRFNNLQQTGRTSVWCQTTSLSGQLSNSTLASFSVIEKPSIKLPALFAKNSSSNANTEFSFNSGSGSGDTSDSDFDSNSGIPPGIQAPVINHNTTTSNSTTTPALENNANRIYFSKNAFLLIMLALGYSLN